MSAKKISIVLIALILIVAGFLGYRNWRNQKNQKNQPLGNSASFSNSLQEDETNEDGLVALDDEMDQAEQDFNAKCENGEWVKVADVSGAALTLSGKMRRVYPEDEIPQELKSFQYFVEGKKEKTALSGKDLSALESFEDREVEVQGAKSEDGKSIVVSNVRCAGAETDKAAIDAKSKLMNWLAANIGSIAPQKAPYRQWVMDTTEFVDEKNVYVEYYDTIEDDDNADVESDTGRKVLLEAAAKPDGGYDVKVLAYWEMGEEDYVLKTGTDKFEDVVDVSSYQYDPESKSWTRM